MPVGRLAVAPPQDQPSSFLTYSKAWNTDGGQSETVFARHLEVSETCDGKVVGNLETSPARLGESAQSNVVAGAEHCRGVLPAGQKIRQSGRASARIVTKPGHGYDARRMKAPRTESILLASAAQLAALVERTRATYEADTLMARVRQKLGVMSGGEENNRQLFRN